MQFFALFADFASFASNIGAFGFLGTIGEPAGSREGREVREEREEQHSMCATLPDLFVSEKRRQLAPTLQISAAPRIQHVIASCLYDELIMCL